MVRGERGAPGVERDEALPGIVGALKLVLNRPAEVFGALAMAGFSLAIVYNALAGQKSMHPAPFFAEQPVAVARAAARTPAKPAGGPAVAGDDTTASLSPEAMLVRDIQLELAELKLYAGVADGIYGPRTAAAIRTVQEGRGVARDGRATTEFLKLVRSGGTSPLKPAAPATRPARRDPIGALIEATAAPVDKRALRVERALSQLAYGPLKVDGIVDDDTRTAIGQFEMDRSMPVTGKVSAALERELTAMLGAPLQ